MKKKVLMLTLALTLVLVGCAGKNAAAEIDMITDAVIEEVTKVEEEVKEEVKEIAEETAEKVVDEVKEAVKDVDYERGIVSETGYESEWMGLRFTAPEGFIMATEDELLSLMGMSKEMLSEDFNSLQLKYAEMSSIYEFMCVAPDQSANINVASEKLMLSNITEEQYVEVLKTQLANLAAMDITIDDKAETATLGGIDFTKLTSKVQYEGNSMYQEYYLRKHNGKMIVMAVTYTDEAAKDKIMNGFGAY